MILSDTGKMKTTWIRGPRTTSSSRDREGREVVLKGKNGGPVVKQEVLKVIAPR